MVVYLHPTLVVYAACALRAWNSVESAARRLLFLPLPNPYKAAGLVRWSDQFYSSLFFELQYVGHVV
jgi:hypothetical protein